MSDSAHVVRLPPQATWTARRTGVGVSGLIILLLLPGCGRETESQPQTVDVADTQMGDAPAVATPGDHSAVSATVDRFHAALQAGDSATAASLLTQDAVILESGAIETRDEYLDHHLGADIAFAGAVNPARAVIQVIVEGDVAWTVAESIAEGTIDGREIRSQGAELMTLVRADQGWRIAAIHWSSRRMPE